MVNCIHTFEGSQTPQKLGWLLGRCQEMPTEFGMYHTSRRAHPEIICHNLEYHTLDSTEAHLQ